MCGVVQDDGDPGFPNPGIRSCSFGSKIGPKIAMLFFFLHCCILVVSLLSPFALYRHQHEARQWHELFMLTLCMCSSLGMVPLPCTCCLCCSLVLASAPFVQLSSSPARGLLCFSFSVVVRLHLCSTLARDFFVLAVVGVDKKMWTKNMGVSD